MEEVAEPGEEEAKGKYRKNLIRAKRIVITQFVARKKGYKIESQTGVTGTNPTQCHHNGTVLSL
jgi:hypothetical protein